MSAFLPWPSHRLADIQERKKRGRHRIGAWENKVQKKGGGSLVSWDSIKKSSSPNQTSNLTKSNFTQNQLDVGHGRPFLGIENLMLTSEIKYVVWAFSEARKEVCPRLTRTLLL